MAFFVGVVGAMFGGLTSLAMGQHRIAGTHGGPQPTTTSLGMNNHIGVVQAGEGQPGILIHQLTTRCECKCICDPSDHEKSLTRKVLAAEWRAYTYTNLREYADWLHWVETLATEAE